MMQRSPVIQSKQFGNINSYFLGRHFKLNAPSFLKHVCWLGLIGVIFLLSTAPGFAQRNLELSGGYAHATGNFGVDGYDLGAAWWFNPKVSMAFNYDDGYDTSTIGPFQLTNFGTIAVKSHLQSYLVGPRIFFGTKKIQKYRFNPFAEAQFGASHLATTIQQAGASSQSASDNAFTWMLGGGGEYHLDAHWSARVHMDLLRTHLADEGQSRLRFVLGVAYNFGSHVH